MANQTHHIHHYHRHMSFSYPVSVRQRLYSLVLIPLLILVVTIAVINSVGSPFVRPAAPVTLGFTIFALLTTFSRLLIAYLLALLLALPAALLINSSPKAERILLPLFDIMQSVPVLAFFPVIILFFVHYNFYNGAAIFVLLVSMMWNIVFSLVGGLRSIPQDILAAAKVFKLQGWDLDTKVIFPAIFPYLVTGSLLAWAAGWSIVIVAEVLHTYIPGGDPAKDLFGIGSLLVSASSNGQHQAFILALVVMVIFVACLNLFVWQKLLRYAERYKFE